MVKISFRLDLYMAKVSWCMAKVSVYGKCTFGVWQRYMYIIKVHVYGKDTCV